MNLTDTSGQVIASDGTLSVGGAAGGGSNVPQPVDPLDEEARANLAAQGIAPEGTPKDLKARGSILPVGVTQEGGLTLALPEFLEGPRRTIMDLIEGRRTSKDISGKEIFDLGALFGGMSPGTGMGAGIARSAAQKTAAPAAEKTATQVAETLAPGVTKAPEVSLPPVAQQATSADMKTAAKTLYQAADDAGVVVKPESFAPMVQGAFREAAKNGLDPTLTPDSVAVLKRMAELANPETGPIAFKTLDLMRQIAGDAMGAQRGNDRRVAGIIVDKIDDYIAKMGADDVVSGNPEVAAQAIASARKLWSTAKKLDTVAALVENAKTSAQSFSGSGFENALRTEFRKLSKNERQMRTFTADEQKAIKIVARGSTGANVARFIGKLAPTGVVSAGFSGGMGAWLGGKVGSPEAGAATFMATGFLGRRVATALTERAVKNVEEIIKAGGSSDLAEGSIRRGRALSEQLRAQIGTAATAEAAD